MKRLLVSVCVLVALLAMTGCTGSQTQSTTTTLGSTTTSQQPSTTTTTPAVTSTTATSDQPPPGLREFGGEEVGFTMWVPEGWVTLSSEEFDPDTVAEVFGDSVDPQMIETVRGVFESGAALFAIDPLPVDGFASNVNVILSPPSGLTPDGLAALIPAQFEQGLGATDVVVDVVEVTAGEAVRVSASVPAVGYEALIYQIFTDEAEWVVTISALDIESLDIDVEALVNSFMPVP